MPASSDYRFQTLRYSLLPALVAIFTGLSANAQFAPAHLAVLRAGDGNMDLHLKQSPIFIDQYNPNESNSAPSYTVSIPTNGADLFFFNGHAATEGNLNRSSDRRQLVFAGYGGVGLLRSNGTPALLDIPRGVCTVESDGSIHTYFYKGQFKDAKVNPRGAVSDGKNNFWACGNAYGTMYFNPETTPQPVRFKSLPSSRAINIINGNVYAVMNLSDARALLKTPGIYQFKDESGAPVSMPRDANVTADLMIPVSEKDGKTVAFDINPQGNLAYIADTSIGILKFAKNGANWNWAYNISIPQNIPKKLNNGTGCFGLVADFSGQDPIIYATTTEGYDGSANSNRVVRVVDTGKNSKVITIAQAPSEKIVFRGIQFTPETNASTASAGK